MPEVMQVIPNEDSLLYSVPVLACLHPICVLRPSPYPGYCCTCQELGPADTVQGFNLA